MKSCGLVLVASLLAACGGRPTIAGTGNPEDKKRLYVRPAPDGDHADALVAGMTAGMSAVKFTVPVGKDADLELQTKVTKVLPVGQQTVCELTIMVMRMPQGDLLGIADGSAYSGGTDKIAADDCLEGLSAALVRGKLKPLLRKRLDAKR